MLLEEVTASLSLSTTPLTKALRKLCLGQLASRNAINRVSNFGQDINRVK